jgi:hypothetical protein
MTTSSDLNMTLTPYTPEMENAALERSNEIDAGTGVEDSGGAEGGQGGDPPQGRVEPEAGERKVIQKSPQDMKRDAIAARFKPEGNTDDTAFDGDLTRPENLYGRAAQEMLEPEPGADAIVGDAIEKAAPQAQPQMITRTVRGKAVTRSIDEWLELASKVDAADSYLEEGRSLLEDAKTLKAERAGRDRQHPDGQSSTQDDEQDATRADGSQHPGDDLGAVVEQIQFGDPKEAAKLLQGAIRKEAGKIADEGHQTRLFNNDLARSQKALADFTAANSELAGDDIASLAIEREMYKLYREDIVALGVIDEAQIPSDPRTLANWHRWYKVNGQTVRSTPDLLTKAKENFVAWRGTSPKPTQQAPRKEAPRVEINVDRDARRAAIPLQPTRAVAPRRDAVLTPKPNSDSDVVKAMRRARGQPVAG